MRFTVTQLPYPTHMRTSFQTAAILCGISFLTLSSLHTTYAQGFQRFQPYFSTPDTTLLWKSDSPSHLKYKAPRHNLLTDPTHASKRFNNLPPWNELAVDMPTETDRKRRAIEHAAIDPGILLYPDEARVPSGIVIYPDVSIDAPMVIDPGPFSEKKLRIHDLFQKKKD